jgi:hypothetical protein
MQVKISQATRMIELLIKARLVPFVVGSPGLGKSSIVHQIAKKHNLLVIDMRLSQCDPTDINGFPKIMGDKAGYVPMNTFPIEGDLIPEGYAGWIIFLDEFNSAPPAVQAAAYKLILDRMLGIYPLHKNVALVCAGNKETDNAIVQPMSTAMQSRLVHMELIVDNKEFIEYAQREGFCHYIPSYLQFKPQALNTFSPDHTDNTYACPRTWEFADRLLKVTHDGDKDRLPMLAGILSEGVAREFLNFIEIHSNLPKPGQIEMSPDTVPVPKETSYLWALTGSISQNSTPKNFTQIVKYVRRMPTEWQIVTMRAAARYNKDLLRHEEMRKWINDSSVEVFA